MNSSFDLVNAPLSVPTLLEASAGTGKTYTIQHLVVRLLLERRGESAPYSVDELCLVTFTKDATAELKSRIRRILNVATQTFMTVPETPEGLMGALWSAWVENPTRILTPEVCDGLTGEALKARLAQTVYARLVAARDQFDDIKIRTIHAFCKDLLTEFAFEAGINLEASLEEDVSELILDESEAFLREHIKGIESESERDALLALNANRWTSLYLAMTTLPSAVTDARFLGCSLTHIALNEGVIDENAPVVPVTNTETFFHAYCRTVPQRVRERMREAGLLGYSDLLTELYRVTHAKSALDEAARDRLIATVANTYRCVLVDEFQDTDPIQYAIFKGLFMRAGDTGLLGYDHEDRPHTAPTRSIFFVGDPKQSIYSFRAADLETYFEARDFLVASGGVVKRLDTNWRSSPAMIAATNALFVGSPGQQTFVHPKLQYSPVNAGQTLSGLWKRNDTGWMSLSPLEFWMGEGPVTSTDYKVLGPGAIAEQIAGMINAGSKSLTTPGAIVIQCEPTDPQRKDDPIEVTDVEGSLTRVWVRALEPKDFAVLVRNRARNAELTDAFKAVGLEVKTDEETSIFSTREAQDLYQTLEAVCDSRNAQKVDRYLSSLFFGASAAQFKAWREDEAAWSGVRAEVRSQLEAAHRDWQRVGLARALAPLLYSDDETKTPGVIHRLAQRQGGEASLIHIEHLVDVLNEASQRYKTPDGLMSWFAEQRVKAPTGERFTTRIHGDENRVQIVTVHKSKGLEYPVVFVFGDYSARPTTFKQHVNRYSVDRWAGTGLTGVASPLTTVTALGLTESEGDTVADDEEARRLAYVAVTRAKYRCVVSLPIFYSRAKTITFYFKGFEKSAWAQILFEAEPTLYGVGTEKKGPVAILFDKLKGDARLDAVVEWIAQCQDFLRTERGFSTTAILGSTQVALTPPASASLSTQAASRIPSRWGRKSFSKLTAHGDDAPYRARFGREEKAERLLFDSLDFPRGAAAGTALHELFEVVAPAMQTVLKTETLMPIRSLEAIPDRQAAHSSAARFLTTIEYRLAAHHLLSGPADGESGFDTRAIEAYNMLLNVLTAPITLKAGELPVYLKDVSVKHQAHERNFTFAIPKEKSLQDLLALLSNYGYHFEGLDVLATLKGYMTGAIDLIFFDRRTGWWVLDWKSNQLSENRASYDRAAMDREMSVHHYRLQYLIYWVALKRHIASLKAFGVTDPELLKLGGAVYVFLRGVSEAGNAAPLALPEGAPAWAVGPQVTGLYVDEADERLIDDLMDFFFTTSA